MSKILRILALFLASLSASAQGTVHFHNRSLTDSATGFLYNAPISGDTVGATAQLFLVTGIGASSTYTPIPGLQTFRDPPNQAFFTSGIVVSVPGVPAGTIGTRVVVRVWQGPDYDTAGVRGQSNEILLGALGGIPASGPPITPPNLDGLQSLIFPFPEPSTLTLGLLGAAVLFFRRPKNNRPLI